MQTKKVDIQQNIYAVACQEILRKGYENASLRTITKKANTSIGNFYHYYASKEALMDDIMSKANILIEKLMFQHFALDVKLTSMDDLRPYVNDDVWWTENFGFALCLEVAIYIKQDIPKYTKQKEVFLKQMRQHVANHMNIKDADDYIVEMVVQMFLDGFVFIVKSNGLAEDALMEFIRLFRSICSVIIPHDS